MNGHYQKALKGNPQHPGAHFYLANALLRRGAAANTARLDLISRLQENLQYY
jgi:hypothetical protein